MDQKQSLNQHRESITASRGLCLVLVSSNCSLAIGAMWWVVAAGSLSPRTPRPPCNLQATASKPQAPNTNQNFVICCIFLLFPHSSSEAFLLLLINVRAEEKQALAWHHLLSSIIIYYHGEGGREGVSVGVKSDAGTTSLLVPMLVLYFGVGRGREEER